MIKRWLRSLIDTTLDRVPSKTSGRDTAPRRAMHAEFEVLDRLGNRAPRLSRELDDRHLVKPIESSQDNALFLELLRIVNEAQARDPDDERRLYSPNLVAALAKGERLDPGSRF